MENERSPITRFTTVYQVLNHLNNCNPARMISHDPHERESVSARKSYALEMWDTKGNKYAFEDETALWASICLLVEKTLKSFTAERAKAFTWCRLGPRDLQLSAEDAAKQLGCSKDTVYRHIAKARDELEARFISAGLLPDPEEEDEKKSKTAA